MRESRPIKRRDPGHSLLKPADNGRQKRFRIQEAFLAPDLSFFIAKMAILCAIRRQSVS